MLERLRRMLLRALARPHSTAVGTHLPHLLLGTRDSSHVLLKNEENLQMEQLRREYRYLLSEMSSQKEQAGELSRAVSLFLKVTNSYWKGLFQCYRFPEGTLPRTDRTT